MRRNTNTKTKVAIISGLIAVVIISNMPMVVNATTFSAYQGLVISGYTLAGTKGTVKVIDQPYISATGLIYSHRDYMVYMNLPSGDSVGAGYIAYKDSGGTIHMYDMTYRYFGGVNVAHDLYNTISVGTSFNAQVTQDSSTSNCWTASTYSSAIDTCFGVGDTHGAAAGNTARNLHFAASGSTDDMPGFFDLLKVAHYSGGSLTFDKYFSQATYYKCSSQNGYVLTYLATYSGGGSKIDSVGTGPRDYSVDNCSIDDPVQDAYGE